ncbi:MAG: hypothetical protein R3B84_24525 [Zavarzinella sp.]
MAPLKNYQSFKNLPPLAGLASFAEASKPGMSVEQCTDRLKRFHFIFRRLHEILISKIPSQPIYELKSGFAHHAYLCAEHVQALRTRIGEMREPPLGLDKIPHDGLEMLMKEIQCAPNTAELLIGIYEVVIPNLLGAITRYMDETNRLTDAPSVRVLRFAHLELLDLIEYGEHAIAAVVEEEDRTASKHWEAVLQDCLDAAGSIDGSGSTGPVPHAIYSQAGFRYDPVPQRDERFEDLWNQGVNAEAFIYDPTLPAKPKTLMMLFKRLREIDVPEMMSSIIYETKGKPWEYYRDMTRQLWDEARHAMMGEVGFVAQGVDWKLARITFNWSMRLNTECTAQERHAVLYFIEQGLMTRTGKRYEWEVAQESGVPLMATIQDFDWADEVLHAAIGRTWYVPEFENLHQALAYGDECWSRILSNWEEVRDSGLTEHHNWWPSLYRNACQAWGIQPDPQVEQFDIDYNGARADLKSIQAGSNG